LLPAPPSPTSACRLELCSLIADTQITTLTFSLSLITRPPPTSTLFPYTTLFRSTTSGEVTWAAFPFNVIEGDVGAGGQYITLERDRKSTRLNSSHLVISYAVFCLKKKSAPEP